MRLSALLVSSCLRSIKPKQKLAERQSCHSSMLVHCCLPAGAEVQQSWDIVAGAANGAAINAQSPPEHL